MIEFFTFALAGVAACALVVLLASVLLYLVESIMVFSLCDVGFGVGHVILRRKADPSGLLRMYRSTRGERLRLSTTDVRSLNSTRLIFTFRGPEPRLRSSRVPIKGVVSSREHGLEIVIRLPLGIWIFIYAWAAACAAMLLLAALQVARAPRFEALWIVVPALIGFAVVFWVRPFLLGQARQMAERCIGDVLTLLENQSE